MKGIVSSLLFGYFILHFRILVLSIVVVLEIAQLLERGKARRKVNVGLRYIGHPAI